MIYTVASINTNGFLALEEYKEGRTECRDSTNFELVIGNGKTQSNTGLTGGAPTLSRETHQANMVNSLNHFAYNNNNNNNNNNNMNKLTEIQIEKFFSNDDNISKIEEIKEYYNTNEKYLNKV